MVDMSPIISQSAALLLRLVNYTVALVLGLKT